jgi:DNA-binding SARP family transcriptional activator
MSEPPRPEPEVRVRLLEGFELTIDGEPWELAPSAERLVAFLALQPLPAARSHVAGVLWGDRTEERAAACLRTAIWRANSDHTGHVVEAVRTRITLAGNVSVDARDAAAHAHAQLSGGAPVNPEVLRGQLLPGWYDNWVSVERERLQQLCLEGMERMAESLLEAGQAHLAVEAALAVLATEPLRESAHRILIDAHVSVGNRAAALRQFERCRALLAQEVGLPPGDAVAAAAARACGPAVMTQTARAVLVEEQRVAVAAQ